MGKRQARGDDKALSVLKRAARHSRDGKTVTLTFGTNEFLALLLNWACHTLSVGVHWFSLVAMDHKLHHALLHSPLRRHTLLLPRVRQNLTITKLNVIGERQRFGLFALEAGYNVLHSDADAWWIRDPWSLLAAGDIVAERIWGKPLSVVNYWGAAICTGFYFLRSTPAVILLARQVQSEIVRKRARQPAWQASDQYFINVLLHQYGVEWAGARMASMSSMASRFTDHNSSIGLVTTPVGSLRLVMLSHSRVPRACPMLSPAELSSLAQPHGARGGRVAGKARWWRSLLTTAVALHCFPPDTQAPGEKRAIFMGHPKHTNAEQIFAMHQRLWLLRRAADSISGLERTDELCSPAPAPAGK